MQSGGCWRDTQKATWSHTVIPSICDLCYWNLIKKIELEFLKHSGLADRAWQTQELVTGWAGGRCGDSLQRLRMGKRQAGCVSHDSCCCDKNNRPETAAGRKGLGWLMVSEVSVPLVGGGRTGLSVCPSHSPPSDLQLQISGSSAPTQSSLESALTDTPRACFLLLLDFA